MDLHEAFEAQKKKDREWLYLVRETTHLTKPIIENDRMVFERDAETPIVENTDGTIWHVDGCY